MSFTNEIDRAYSSTRMTAEEERKAAMKNVCAVPGCDATRNLYTCERHHESGEAALRCEMHSSLVMMNGHERVVCLECALAVTKSAGQPAPKGRKK